MVVESPSVATFETPLDMFLCDPLWMNLTLISTFTPYHPVMEHRPHNTLSVFICLLSALPIEALGVKCNMYFLLSRGCSWQSRSCFIKPWSFSFLLEKEVIATKNTPIKLISSCHVQVSRAEQTKAERGENCQ